MDIATFNNIAPRLPAAIAILIQGPTGIGKSHLVHAIGADLELLINKGSIKHSLAVVSSICRNTRDLSQEKINFFLNESSINIRVGRVSCLDRKLT